MKIDSQFLYSPSPGSVLSIVILCMLTVACSTTPPRKERITTIEIDENTDPRFTYAARTGEIGVVIPAGEEVFLNGRNIRTSIELPNNDHVSTGSNSAARIEFSRGPTPCRIEVSDYQYGKLYGDTGSCRHELEIPHGSVRTDTQNAQYHIAVNDIATEITVISGTMIAWSMASSSQTIILESGMDAILTPGGVVGPSRVPGNEIRRRIEWRDKYTFRENISSRSGTAAKVVGGILGAIVVHEILDRDRDRDRDRDDNRHQNDDVGSQNQPPKGSEVGPVVTPSSESLRLVPTINRFLPIIRPKESNPANGGAQSSDSLKLF